MPHDPPHSSPLWSSFKATPTAWGGGPSWGLPVLGRGCLAPLPSRHPLPRRAWILSPDEEGRDLEPCSSGPGRPRAGRAGPGGRWQVGAPASVGTRIRRACRGGEADSGDGRRILGRGADPLEGVRRTVEEGWTREGGRTRGGGGRGWTQSGEEDPRWGGRRTLAGEMNPRRGRWGLILGRGRRPAGGGRSGPSGRGGRGPGGGGDRPAGGGERRTLGRGPGRGGGPVGSGSWVGGRARGGTDPRRGRRTRGGWGQTRERGGEADPREGEEDPPGLGTDPRAREEADPREGAGPTAGRAQPCPAPPRPTSESRDETACCSRPPC